MGIETSKINAVLLFSVIVFLNCIKMSSHPLVVTLHPVSSQSTTPGPSPKCWPGGCRTAGRTSSTIPQIGTDGSREFKSGAFGRQIRFLGGGLPGPRTYLFFLLFRMERVSWVLVYGHGHLCPLPPLASDVSPPLYLPQLRVALPCCL